MLYINDLLVDPDNSLSDQLKVFQDEVNAIANDKDRPTAVDVLWTRYSRQVFFSRNLLPVLRTMCGGIDRCCYCENSTGHTCEHIVPKAHYPESTFVWKNFLAICGDCNSCKNDNWAVLLEAAPSATNRQVLVVKGRKSKDDIPIIPPSGTEMLLNPRSCNPMEAMRLLIDIEDDKMEFAPFVPDVDSAIFQSYHGQGEKFKFDGLIVGSNQIGWTRAYYSILTLKLNLRPELTRRRRLQYSTFKERLHSYIERRDSGTAQSKLDRLKKEFQMEDHPSVWFEIKRCFENGSLADIDPDFYNDLSIAPEALTW